MFQSAGYNKPYNPSTYSITNVSTLDGVFLSVFDPFCADLSNNTTLSTVETSSASLSPLTDLEHTTGHHEVETSCFLPSTQSIASSNQPVPELPPYSDMDEPCFNWALDGATFYHASTSAYYAEAIHWRLNLFSVPSGKAGTSH